MHKIELPIKNEDEKKWIIYGNDASLKQWQTTTHDALIHFRQQKNGEKNTEEKSNK